MTYQAEQLAAGQALGAVPLVVFLLVVCSAVLLYLMYGVDADGTADVYLAGRSLRPLPNALALTGDYISVVTLLSVTGSVALTGFSGMAQAAGGVGALGVLLLLARPLRDVGRFTLGDTWDARFPGPAARVAGTVATLCFCLPLTVVQLVVAGSAVSFLLGVSDIGPAARLCTALIGGIMISAASLSGMRGNTILQVIKTVVLLLAMTVLAGQVMDEFGWNPNRLLDAAGGGSADPAGFHMGGLFRGDGPDGPLSQISALITVVLGAGMAPHLLMRLKASDHGASARRTVKYTVGLVGAFSVLAILLGLGATALVGEKGLAAADPEGLATLPLLALQLAENGAAGGAILALTVSMIFLTSLTVVASLTLSSAASLAHDVFAGTVGRGRSMTTEIQAMRWAGALVGVLAVVLAVGLQGRNVLFLAHFAITAGAAAILPALVLGLFWPGCTRAGMLWSVYGGLVCCAVLQVSGPAVSGSPGSTLPGIDVAWFPLETTGLVSVPVGFLLGWVASRVSGSSTTRSTDEELEEWAVEGSSSVSPASRPRRHR
ncbi:cation acetate symporter [Streptomyces sp. NPDC057287]|uniref:sodium:solute symporter family transporter n=1 Tax=Streptomyces sp. NPDC057287 TaxID=3346086 RepID=UPI00363B2BBF